MAGQLTIVEFRHVYFVIPNLFISFEKKRNVFYSTRPSSDFIGISALTFNRFLFDLFIWHSLCSCSLHKPRHSRVQKLLRLMRKRMKNKLMQKLIQYLGQWISSRSARQFQSEPKTFKTKKFDKFSAAQEHLPKVVRFLKKRFR